MSAAETFLAVSTRVLSTGFPQRLTVHARVVWLDMGLLDLAVLDQQGIALAALIAKDGTAVEREVQGFGEGASRVGNEADLGCS